MALQPYRDHIRQMLVDGFNYTDISSDLRQRGIFVGSSVANVRLFCRQNEMNIRAGVVQGEQLDFAIADAVLQVCLV